MSLVKKKDNVMNIMTNKQWTDLLSNINKKWFEESMNQWGKAGSVSRRRAAIVCPSSTPRDPHPNVNPKEIDRLSKNGTNVEIVTFIAEAMRPYTIGRKKTGDRSVYEPMANPIPAIPEREMSILKHKIYHSIPINESDCQRVADEFRRIVDERGADYVFDSMCLPTTQQYGHEWDEWLYKKFPCNVPKGTRFESGESLVDLYDKHVDNTPMFYMGADDQVGKMCDKYVKGFTTFRSSVKNKNRKNPDGIVKVKCINGKILYVIFESEVTTDQGGGQSLGKDDAVSLSTITQVNGNNYIVGLALIDGTPWDIWINQRNRSKPGRLNPLTNLAVRGIVHPWVFRSYVNEVIELLENTQ